MVSLQANSDSGVAVAAVAALIQSVALLFAPRRRFVERPCLCSVGFCSAFLEYRGKIFAHQTHPAQLPLCRIAGSEICGAIFR